MPSILRETMEGQPAALARAARATRRRRARRAERLRGRRVLLAGTGTSWHAAGHGAALLRLAGLEAWPVAALDARARGPARSTRRVTRSCC